jgi:hypothetical protein
MHSIKPLLLAISILAIPIAAARADEPAAAGRRTALEDRLKTGLRPRRPEEIGFIEDVAQLVRMGRLPEKIVDSTYLWAIQRQRKYPYPLFERALRIQADRLGVEL